MGGGGVRQKSLYMDVIGILFNVFDIFTVKISERIFDAYTLTIFVNRKQKKKIMHFQSLIHPCPVKEIHASVYLLHIKHL